MSKIILLGASGFVGKALTPLLEAAGLTFVAPSSKTLNLADASAVAAIAALVEDGDSVMMLSAYTPEKGDAGELAIKNILMVKHLLAGIKDRALMQCIYVSSDAVYPLSADSIDEQTPPCPYDLYGQMHLAREQYLRSSIAPDKLAILRPCAIYGAGDTHNSYGINRFVRTSLAAGEITLFGGGEEYRDHVHVGDVARLILAVHQQQFAGVLNIASGRSWRFGDIAACIKARAEREVRIIHKPRAMAITHRHFNITKLLRQFPNQRPCGIDAGIEALLKTSAVAA